MRSERAIPLFEYIVKKLDRTGPLRRVYLHAVESLGALKAEQSIELLKETLHQGEWWAPFRTKELRRTVATALHQIGTPGAVEVLQDAAASGPRGVRAPYGASTHEDTLMLDHHAVQLSDEFLRRLGASLRGIQLYAQNHPIVARNLAALGDALRSLHEHDASSSWESLATR